VRKLAAASQERSQNICAVLSAARILQNSRRAYFMNASLSNIGKGKTLIAVFRSNQLSGRVGHQNVS
jgi:hypothetical protein